MYEQFCHKSIHSHCHKPYTNRSSRQNYRPTYLSPHRRYSLSREHSHSNHSPHKNKIDDKNNKLTTTSTSKNMYHQTPYANAIIPWSGFKAYIPINLLKTNQCSKLELLFHLDNCASIPVLDYLTFNILADHFPTCYQNPIPILESLHSWTLLRKSPSHSLYKVYRLSRSVCNKH